MALVIKYEKPDQRRHYRVTAPLFVTLNDKKIRAADWSVGGLRLEELEGKLPAIGKSLAVQITLPFHDFEISFDTELEVVRHVEGQKGFGARFTALGEREQGLMVHFIDEIVRGSMADVKETIARMDVPVTPVSTTPEKKPLPATTVQRWTSKAYVVPVLYGLLGLLVFGYAGLVAYSNIFHLVVESAVVGGRVGLIKAQVDGEIDYKNATVGKLVKTGEIIAKVNDPVLEARIEKAAIQIQRKLAEQSFLQQQTGVASSRSAEIIRQKSGSVKNQRQRVRKIAAEVKKARATYRSLLRRRKRGRASKERVANARAALSKLRTRLGQARQVLSGRAKLLKRTGKAGLFGKQLALSNDPLYKARLELIKNEVEFARHDHQTLLRLREARTLKAPFAARIVDLPKRFASTVMRGDVVVVLEPLASREATAFLTQKESLKVKIGDMARVFIPALDQSFGARIKAVGQPVSFVNIKEGSFGWRPTNERNARVTLELSAKDLAATEALSAGMPAVIRFNDRETNGILSRVLPGFFKSDRP